MLVKLETTHLIMVTYFRPTDLRQCVESILINTHEPYRLSIIDNSHGGLDHVLDTFTDPHITIYKNDSNLGKGKAFMKWYQYITHNSKADHFISIDPDLVVPPNWLLTMQLAAYRIRAKDYQLGAIAPVLMNESNETFEKQLQRDRLVMHNKTNNSRFVHPHIYSNRHIAGPLLLIDRKFFESVGGYVQNQLYGNDDGELCKAAAKQQRFIGIITDVEVLHLATDNCEGYRQWKLRNVHGNSDVAGFWDESNLSQDNRHG